MKSLYSAGLVGYGLAGSAFHAPVLTGSGRFGLRAVVTSRRDQVSQDYPDTQVCPDVDTLLAIPELDVVVIATPNTTHLPIARAALEAGKHVILDKPWVISSADGEALLQHAERHKRLLSVYQNRRWDNDFLYLRRLLEEGTLGSIHEFHSHYDRFRPHVRDRWREQNIPGSGILYDLGPHLIDQAVVLFGIPQSLIADVAAVRPGSEIEDYFHIMLDYPQIKVILHSGCYVARPQTDRFRVYGSSGSWRVDGLDPQEPALRAGERPSEPGWILDPPDRRGELCLLDTDGQTALPPEYTRNPPSSYTGYYRQFAEALDGTAAVPVDPSDALTGIRIIEAALQSAADGRRVFL